jgi:peptidoglycan/LPS O-acetylase OafA/YrhL
VKTYTVQATGSPEPRSVRPAAVLVERRLTSLDGWRGAAILLVFVRHYFLTRNVHSLPIQIASWIAGAGWIGVDLFFVLSGFLITGILLDTRGHKHYFRNFYMRRTLRIFPLYYGVLFLALAVTPFLHLSWRIGDVAHFLYVGNIATTVDPSLADIRPWIGLGPTWSLAVEEQFYLLWPLTILWIADRRPLRWIGGFMAIILALRIALLIFLPLGSAFEWSYHVLPMRADGLLCGAAAAILLRSGTLEEALHRLRWPLWAAAACLAAILALDRRLEFHSIISSILVFPSLGILFTCLLLTALRPRSWAYRIGNVRWLRFFGRYSYGMYIFHRLINSDGMMRWLQVHTHSFAIGGILYVIVVFVLTTIAAVLSYELYERHFLKLKRNFQYSPEMAT